MTQQLIDKLCQPLNNAYANVTCSDDDTNILEMHGLHANNSNNCLDYSLLNDDVPFLQNYGSINTAQFGDQDIINMSTNVHDSNNNDILSTIDPDNRYVSMVGQIAIILTAMNFNTKFNKTERFSIFHKKY